MTSLFMLHPTPSKRQFHARRGEIDLCGIQYMVMCKIYFYKI